jgi:hypothetical protein
MMRLFPRLLSWSLAALLAWPESSLGQGTNPGTADVYTLCAFYPQAAPCAALYQQVLTESAPPALAVKQAFEGYARYLGQRETGLTDQDRQYLTANGLRIPDDLDAADKTGLHNVINDPALAADADARQRAVNNFIGRARQAELFCHFNVCPGTPTVQPGAS